MRGLLSALPEDSYTERFQPNQVIYDPLRSLGLLTQNPAGSGSSTELGGSAGSVVPRRVVNPIPPRPVSLTIPNPRLNAEAIRATGPFSGGSNAAYAQNIATYAGGNFQRRGGNLAVSPFGTSPFSAGTPMGQGNAPVMGTPNTLLNEALGIALVNPQALNALFPGINPGLTGS